MSESSNTPQPIFSDEDRTSSSSSPNTIPLTPDDVSRWQCHIDLQDFGDSLQAAANAVFPNTSRSRYKKVSVLLLSWEDEDPQLPVSVEIEQLDIVFKNLYGFETETWKIPNQNSHGMLNRKILDFVMTEDDPADHLFIVYYGGHAKLTKDRLLSWTSWRNNQNSKCPTVQWSGIQNALEQAASDVLILLDCCYAGTANASDGNGVTELISACAFNAAANPVGSFSFTKQLVIELRDLSSTPSFTVAELYRNVFCRIQSRIPEDPRERHPAPIHFSLTQDNPHFPRSIQLSVRPGDTNKRNAARNLAFRSAITGRGSAISTLTGNEPTSNPDLDSLPEDPLISSISNLSNQAPRMLLAVRLNDTFRPGELSLDLFKDWLRRIPTVAEEVKVEAGFGSFSSILIVSIPIAVSLYLPQDPSIIRIGPITSLNLVEETPGPTKGQQTSKPYMRVLPPLTEKAVASLDRSVDLLASPVLENKALVNLYPYADSAYASSSALTEYETSDILLNYSDSTYESGLLPFEPRIDDPNFVTVVGRDKKFPEGTNFPSYPYSNESESYISEIVQRRSNRPLKADGKVGLVFTGKNRTESAVERGSVRPDNKIKADAVFGLPEKNKRTNPDDLPRRRPEFKAEPGGNRGEVDANAAFGSAIKDSIQQLHDKGLDDKATIDYLTFLEKFTADRQQKR